MCRRPIWRVAGMVTPSFAEGGRPKGRSEHRAVLLAAKDFDEAVRFAKAALLQGWSSQPHEAVVKSVAPFAADVGDEQALVVYLDEASA